MNNDDWDLTDYECGGSQVIIAMYFALTTVSTTGFGDLYPKSDFERLVCAFMMLSGVSLFSYVLSQLRHMVKQKDSLEGGFDHRDKLDSFFKVLQEFNMRKEIETELQNRIRRFMTEKWDRDKNNFHLTDLDESLLSQLSIDCKMDLYTKFIFKDFIVIFRRFF